MKRISTIFFILFAVTALGQKSIMFKNYSFDSTYRIIGVGPWAYNNNFDKQKETYERFCFMIDQPKDLQLLKKNWVFRESAEIPAIQMPCFTIYVLKDKKLENSWIINPKLENIRTDDGFYQFNIMELKKLHEEHPFKYTAQKDTFSSETEFNTFYDSAQRVTSFLFLYKPNFNHECEFKVSVSAVEFSPSTATDALYKEFETILPRNRCRIFYNPADDKDTEIHIMTVYAPKLLFERYSSEKFIISNCQQKIFESTSFWVEY